MSKKQFYTWLTQVLCFGEILVKILLESLKISQFLLKISQNIFICAQHWEGDDNIGHPYSQMCLSF